MCVCVVPSQQRNKAPTLDINDLPVSPLAAFVEPFSIALLSSGVGVGCVIFTWSSPLSHATLFRYSISCMIVSAARWEGGDVGWGGWNNNPQSYRKTRSSTFVVVE